jgi:lysophospholipase L1-like esterase
MLLSSLFAAWGLPRPLWHDPHGRRVRGGSAVRPAVERLEERCAPATVPNPAVVPAPNPDPGWIAETHIVTREPRGNPRVIFLGDSITEFFADGEGAPVWRHRVAPLRADNFGVRSSTTQNVLYQINQGLLSNLNARVVVLMIGVNNLLHGATPAQTAAGVGACLADIRMAQPRARILLLGLLPAGWTASDPLRVKVEQTNALLPQFTDGRVVRYADVGGVFLRRDGSIAPGMMMSDAIHPTERGYRSIIDSLGGTLWALLHAPQLPPPRSPSTGHGGPRR